MILKREKKKEKTHRSKKKYNTHEKKTKRQKNIMQDTDQKTKGLSTQTLLKT